MKLKFKKWLLLISFVSLGLLSTSAINIEHPAIHIHTVQASRISYNNYLRNRIDRYAYQRRHHYYPQINYNFRGLSGLKTANGRYQIKGDRLFRSGNLEGLSVNGARKLSQLHVKEDIDLRYKYGNGRSIKDYPGPGEFHFAPNRVGVHLRYKYDPVETSAEENKLWPFRKKYGETYRFGAPYTTDYNARKSYHRAILSMISEARRHNAVMWNCTQGRDRTGVLAAIALNILGVSRRTIYNDFLLTNHYKYQSPYTDQVSRINKFYRTVHRTYGTMYRYLHDGLYLSNHEMNEFRHEFLVKVHHHRK